MNDQPGKLDLRSHDIAEAKRQELLRLFPEIRTEGGKLDFERLKLALGESVDVGKERYGMTWPGKADCFKVIQTPSLGTLRPCPEESVSFDTTENLIIEGDNLEVLKLLQKSYLGKIKMIYIDPPYNTGNDFIYPDDYTESLQTYLEYTGQVDSEGRKFGTNTDTDGRFHSKWLNMMYPRLYVARNLLREDGVIFITVGDSELANLFKLGHEVFGEENFIAIFVWEKRTNRENRKGVSSRHDYVVCYCRNSLDSVDVINMLPMSEEALARYKNPDNDPRGPWKSDPATAQAGHGTKNQFYVLTAPNGTRHELPSGRCWVLTKEVMDVAIKEGRIWFGQDGNGVPRIKTYLNSKDRGLIPESIWFAENVSTNEAAKNELKELFDGHAVFDTPKPVPLVIQMLRLSADDGIVLDFFAGSGTTAEAVLRLNNQDAGNRKFILVQLPEACEPESTAYRAGYKTIADICKERVRRVIRKFNKNDGGELALHSDQQDLGFRVFKLAESNFRLWDAEAPKDIESLAKQLELHVHHVRDGRTEQDILFELLLKSGFPLTTPVQPLKLEGKQVYGVANGAMLICLERELTLQVIRAMADKKPERVVCLDEGFAGNDQLKANAVQIFKTKGIASFKTV